MTQLVELRDAHERIAGAGLRLYAVSYDDHDALSEFAKVHAIPYTLLSDVDSEVIRAYGILNEQIAPGDGPLYGIPYPGTYVTDEGGVVTAKFFHDSYKKRDSPEDLIDAALGRIVLAEDAPRDAAGEDDVRVSATFHGGGGTLKQGAQRRVVVRFEMADGLHVYVEPVPEGMVPTTVDVTGPEGLAVGEPILPPTEPLRLEALGLDLHVWSGTVDIAVPVHALSSLASECRPLEKTSASLEVRVRYQACDDETCLLPRTETLHLEVPVEPVDVPSISLHTGHGQNESPMDGEPHFRRLMLRKIRQHPVGFLRFVSKTIRLELAARRRRREGSVV